MSSTLYTKELVKRMMSSGMRLMEKINNIGDAIFKSNFQSTYHKCFEASDPMNAIDLRNYFYENKYGN